MCVCVFSHFTRECDLNTFRQCLIIHLTQENRHTHTLEVIQKTPQACISENVEVSGGKNGRKSNLFCVHTLYLIIITNYTHYTNVTYLTLIISSHLLFTSSVSNFLVGVTILLSLTVFLNMVAETMVSLFYV